MLLPLRAACEVANNASSVGGLRDLVVGRALERVDGAAATEVYGY